MFNGSWKEKEEVKIVDASAAAFKEFLQIFYVDQMKLTMENVAKVMDLGNRYDVIECFKACATFLKDQMTEDNVCLALGLAILYEKEDLKRFCSLFISENPTDVFDSAHFLECSRDVLAHILKLDCLKCSEVELFEASMAWVKAASEQDNITKELIETHLGDSFHDIRCLDICPPEILWSIYSSKRNSS